MGKGSSYSSVPLLNFLLKPSCTTVFRSPFLLLLLLLLFLLRLFTYVRISVIMIFLKVFEVPSADQRNRLLREELGKLVLPRRFQLPLSPFMNCAGIDVAKCKVEVIRKKKLLLMKVAFYVSIWSLSFLIFFLVW